MAEIDLKKKFPLMTPNRKPPALSRINGCGFAIYGSRDSDAETGTYVTTWCFSLVFVPILALRAYRVAPAQKGWYFIGREPLSKFAKGWNTLLIAAALAVFGAIQIQSYISSPAYKARQQMATARREADQGHLGRAAEI